MIPFLHQMTLKSFATKDGAAYRIRTGDLFITNELLYQLS